MKQQRVTTDELLELRERVMKLHDRAKNLSQACVHGRLDLLFQHIDEAARSTALDEAVTRRREAVLAGGADE